MSTDNVEFFRSKLITPIEPSEILFDGKTFFEDYHSQDCCEQVYADWDTAKKNLDTLKNQIKTIAEISVSGTPGMGFTIFFYDGTEKYGEPHRYGVFVPCYNSQNGYYSSDLSLIIRINGKEEEIEVSEFVKDEID